MLSFKKGKPKKEMVPNRIGRKTGRGGKKRREMGKPER